MEVTHYVKMKQATTTYPHLPVSQDMAGISPSHDIGLNCFIQMKLNTNRHFANPASLNGNE